MGTLRKLVSDEKERRNNDFFIELNDGNKKAKKKKEKKAKKAKKTHAQHQPRMREPFDEEAWNEVYKQACEDLTPEELEACKYITPTDSLSDDLLTPEEFAALTL